MGVGSRWGDGPSLQPGDSLESVPMVHSRVHQSGFLGCGDLLARTPPPPPPVHRKVRGKTHTQQGWCLAPLNILVGDRRWVGDRRSDSSWTLATATAKSVPWSEEQLTQSDSGHGLWGTLKGEFKENFCTPVHHNTRVGKLFPNSPTLF